MEFDELMQCPYDKNHMIRPSRFPYHLVKCRENNRAAAKILATCPYNARHRVPKQELDLHMASCEYRVTMEPISAAFSHQKVETSTWQSPPCEEVWETDEDPVSRPKPFILNDFTPSQPFNMSEGDGNMPYTGISSNYRPEVQPMNSVMQVKQNQPEPEPFTTSERNYDPRSKEPPNPKQPAVNGYKPATTNTNPWCRQTGGSRGAAPPKLGAKSSDEGPRNKEFPTPKANLMNEYVPVAANANPWCRQPGGSSAASEPLGVDSFDEWPCLGRQPWVRK
ncbi:hypothetical protein XELAEV_18013545mg [Xenopus laevis]|uniref:CHHC U11-48K-type domain-containing protein n=1 Tax=Xenopus laevis TaxID=8355 RepID=A0A974HZJ3_XENLA|nr:hypothetical protein XELAEV_18013545mg [Xenopus laevis]